MRFPLPASTRDSARRAARSGLAIAAFLLGGCTTLPVAHYRTAKPLAKDATQLTFGMSIPKDGGHGIDKDRTPGASVTEHHGLVNLVDVNYYVGLSKRTEFSVHGFLAGLKAGVRTTFVDTNIFKAAIGAYGATTFGNFEYNDEGAGSTGGIVQTRGTVSAQWIDVPLTLSFHPHEIIAIFFGPTFTQVSAVGSLVDEDLDSATLSDRYQRRVHTGQFGGFIGAQFGDKVQFTPGFTIYREPTQYPIKSGKKGAFLYPFVGLNLNWGGPKPAPKPLASPPEPAPSPE